MDIEEQASLVRISSSTLGRAKAELDIRSEKIGNGPWIWRLPDTAPLSEDTSMAAA
jgi:hypothetical protein